MRQPVEMSGDNMRKFFRGICGVLATLLTLCILLMAAGLTERRFFYVEGAPVYWDNVLGQPLWGIDGLGYVSGYISRPPGLYLVLGAAAVLALLCIFPLRRRKGEKTEESPTGRCRRMRERKLPPNRCRLR